MLHESNNEVAKLNLFETKEFAKPQFVDREEAITQIISQFKDIIEKEANVNLHLKKQFFYICSAILVSLTIMMLALAHTIVRYHLPDNSLPYAVELVSVIGAFVTAFMVLPRIIASDLFSAKIQESIVRIINHNKDENK